MQLLKYLDGLPLAITQAGAFLQESGMNLKAYLQMYEEQREEVAELLHGSNIPLRDYPGRSVWTTWIISYNGILARNKHAAHLLLLWSFLNNGDLWYGMFEEATKRRASIAQALSKWLGSITNDWPSFANAMKLLRSYSLIEGSEQSDGYSMHSVVHRWTYFYQGLRRQSDIGMLALAVVGGAVPHDIERDYARLQLRLLSHAQVCCVRALNEQVTINRSRDHEYVSAPIIDQVKKEDILEAIHYLGMLYWNQGKLDEAEKIYMRALQGKEKALGAKHILTINTVNNLGLVYWSQGKLDEAEKMFMRALQGYEEAIGAKHTLTLQAINNLGIVYHNQGKLAEAEEMYMRVLQGYEEAFRAKHTLRLNNLNNPGMAYKDQGRLAEAEKMYVRAVQGKEEAIGAKHILTLNTLSNLGLVYQDQGKLDEAEKMFMRALQGYEDALGAKHTSTLRTLNHLSLLSSEQGKLCVDQCMLLKAEKMLLRVLQGFKETLGAKHKSTIISIKNLGIVYKDQGILLKDHSKLLEAEKMLLLALQGFEEVVGAKHRLTLDTLSNLGGVYNNQGILFKDQSKILEAEKMLLRALQGFEKTFGDKLVKTHVLALSNMRNLGDLYSETRPDESRVMYAKALSGYTIVRGESSDVCLDIKRRLEALDASLLQDNKNSKLRVSSTEENLSNRDNPQRRQRMFKKLIRNFKN